MNPTLAQQELVSQMTKFMDLVSADFKETVQTWKKKHQPKFEPKVKATKKMIKGEVSTVRKIYGYVSNGTKDHFIAPKNARMLRFKSKYTAKTAVGRIPSSTGGASGKFAFSRGHMVKGIKPRNFPLQIRNKREQDFKDALIAGLEKIIESN